MFIGTVKKLLQEKNISVNKMAQDLHFGTGTFRTWETRGTVPDGETLLKIARYFGVTVDYLLGNEEKEKALPSPAQSLNETEAELVKAFRSAAPETQDAVLRVLQIDTGRTQRKDA